MRAADYQGWFKRASQNVEAALGTEMSTPSRNVITEDYVRASFMRGFALAYPSGAAQVERETPVSWTEAACVGGHAIGGSGRPLQHDVGLSRQESDPNDNGAILEVKWLTTTSTSTVAQDIWKLALSRGTMPERTAVRAYLALGGDMKAVSNTLAGLRNIGLTLRWSSAGRGKDQPAPSGLHLDRAIRTPGGTDALQRLLSRGNHFRTPPACWARLRASLRSRWFRRVDEFMESEAVAWRFLVWELDHRGIGRTDLDWDALLPQARIQCSSGD